MHWASRRGRDVTRDRPATHLGPLSRALLHGRASRLRTTDWWAVLIEIAVVVLGILIAFELNEWYQRRQLRAQEQQTLAHLREEAKADHSALQRARTLHLSAAENFRLLSLAVTGPPGNGIEQTYNDTGSRDPCHLERLPAVKRASAGSGGLASSERLAVIEDSRVRDLLRQAAAEQAFTDSQLSYFRASFQRYAAMLEPHMVWRIVPGSEQPSCAIDLVGLRQDRATSSMLAKMSRDQRTFANFREREVEVTRQLHERVDCLLRRRCEVDA